MEFTTDEKVPKLIALAGLWFMIGAAAMIAELRKKWNEAKSRTSK